MIFILFYAFQDDVQIELYKVQAGKYKLRSFFSVCRVYAACSHDFFFFFSLRLILNSVKIRYFKKR